MISTDTPFVILDDARPVGAAPARYYSAPERIIVAHDHDEMPEIFAALRDAGKDGKYVAGYLAYEGGHGLVGGHIGDMVKAAGPLAWFGIFDGYQQFDNDVIMSRLPNPAGAYLTDFHPEIGRNDYAAAFAKVKNYIAAGDIYQANLTFRAAAYYAGHPLALYAAIRPGAAAGYGGVIWTGDRWILSFSPELFFAMQNGRIMAKPMKGTAVRMTDDSGDRWAADRRAAQILHDDPKQRAENLMIVDLMRNDLSRVSVAGSVHVPDLFHVETYPTVHQMTSTILGEIKPGLDVIDVMAAIFPCGSITGAPKIRAMQIIDEIEQSARGVYCGSIGRIDAGGDAAFNVAIRSFSIDETEKHLSNRDKPVSRGQVVLGLGSGIVADSGEAAEWAECLAKGGFAKMRGTGFDLFETMRFEPDQGIMRLEMHLERMKESARALGFEFDRHAARNQLHAVTFYLEEPVKLRLLLSKSGAIAIETAALPLPPAGPFRVKIVPLPVDITDFRLTHKSTDRAFYDDARNMAGDVDEVIFARPDGLLTEGSFTSLYVKRQDKLLTPALHHGLLPSILRRELIESGDVEECDIRIADLNGEFFVGNSLRGLIPAKLVA